ncbi:universal stress protein, partial [Actinosynnema sp. NPDC023658]|uniref:universal stress protein n=1 Tax=Actinosynnema sp. NPDC023658 TaxID=3155465 RepID=UPI0034029D87
MSSPDTPSTSGGPSTSDTASSALGRGAVVVGFDGSEQSRQAAHWAAREASSRGVRLVVVNAIRGPFPEVVVTPVTMPLPQLIDEEAVRGYVRDHLTELAAEIAEVAPGVEVDTHVLDGHPAAVLGEVARDAAALVVGSSGMTGLTRVFAGSVAAGVANHATGPVVVVRGDGDGRGDGRVVVGVDGSESS